MNSVSLEVNGVKHFGWNRLNIKRSLSTLCSSFSISLSHNWKEKPIHWRLSEGDLCELFLNDHLVITGYIGSLRELSSGNSTNLSVSGRDITCDLVDCNLPTSNERRVWNNATFKTILNDLLSSFNLKSHFEVDTGAKINSFGIQDEPVFSSLDRAAKLRGLILYTNSNGVLVVSKPRKTGAVQAKLIHGDNILSLERTTSGDQRYSEYIIQHTNFGMAENQIDKVQIVARTLDSEVKRNRTLVINTDFGQEGLALKRLQWEKTIRAAKSEKLRISVPQWLNAQGVLWELNQLVHVSSRYFGIEGTYIISDISFDLDEQNGSKTELGLENPDAYQVDETIELQHHTMRDFLAKKDSKEASDE